MAFGDQIMELLQSRDMTQKELAKALSLPVTTLNGYVRGHREPDYETLQRFADYFGVSCDYLLDYSVNKENQTRLTALSAEEYRFIGVWPPAACGSARAAGRRGTIYGQAEQAPGEQSGINCRLQHSPCR